MQENLIKFLPELKKHEGGYVNHPSDPGGCTNYGITIGTYRRRINSQGTCTDLKNMTWEEGARIYSETYWNDVQGDKLPHGVDVSVFDMGVNAGPSRAIRLLQRALGISEDGIYGQVTWDAIEDRDTETLIWEYHEVRQRYYQSLKTWPTFGKGWTRRNNGTKEFALQLLAGNVEMPEIPITPPTETITRHDIPTKRCTVSTALNKSEPEVRTLQSLLLGLGYDVGLVDGIAGPRTDAAIREFQSRNDLTADGICGPKTWVVVEGLRPNPAQ